MASPFAEALQSAMVASFDPNIAMQRDAMQGFIQTQQNTLVLEKAKTVAAVAELLDKASKSEAPDVVIKTYESLLAQLEQ